MAFNGYLIKVNEYDTFFNKYISAESYNIAKKILDVDSYRDANGELHRQALDHCSYTISMELKPLDSDEMETLMTVLRSNFSVPLERKLPLQFYVPEDNAYTPPTDVYMPDIEYKIQRITNNKIYYDKTTLKFIAY